jgi:hypothetical protein
MHSLIHAKARGFGSLPDLLFSVPHEMGDAMNARKVAAQFAAYAWYEKCRAGRQSAVETARFARENWTAFLSVAHEGWGKLLIRIGRKRGRVINLLSGTRTD